MFWLPLHSRYHNSLNPSICLQRFWPIDISATIQTRHRASASMYSLTFRVHVTTPRSVDEMERRTQQVRRLYCRRGESSPASTVCGCGVRWAWQITAGLCHAFPSAATAMQPVHWLQTRLIVHNWGQPLPLPKLHPGPCNSVSMQPRTDRQTDRRAWP